MFNKNKKLRIISDANIWGAEHAFETLSEYHVQLEILEHHEITPERVKDIDILLVRSSTKVNQGLLEGSSVRFVGTATIGDDHVDKEYLHKQGIVFSSAAGSSTESVVEFMLASFFQLEYKGKLSFQDDALGIIGVGRIGSLLDTACSKLGFKTLFNDPPRQLAEGSNNFHSLDYVLEHADVLTLHTPLIKEGEFKTTLLIGEQELKQFKGKALINAGRGPCLDNTALLDWLNKDDTRFAVLDCWENEPSINLSLLDHPQVLIATPHIAGHSLDGKAANTYFVYRDLCAYLKVKPTWDTETNLPVIPNTDLKGELIKAEISKQLYPIQQDTSAMKQEGHQADTFITWFRQYRRHYPVRRSWKKTLAEHPNYDEGLFF
ncbi:MAG: 4-phosphoerythronate dehydrogenase [Ghiorsea sp.]